MKRRSFLQGAGAVTVLVAGGLVWRAYDQGVFSIGKGPAYEPWKNWNDAQHGPLGLVSAAILAASPHNTQPWRFRVTDSQIELYADVERNTGALDPFLRELHLGLGCALENLMLAAKVEGYQATLTTVPGKLQAPPQNPVPELVARIELAPGAKESSELHDAIPRRHTNRAPYNQKAIPADVLNTIAHLAESEAGVKTFLFVEPGQRDKIVTLIADANEIVYSDSRVREGSDRWIRLRWSEIQRYHDGLTMDAMTLPPTTTTIAKMIPEAMLRKAAVQTRDMYSDLLRATPVFGTIAVHDRYDRERSLRAGRVWQRTHLWLTAHNLVARPVNEMVELVDYERMLNQEPRAAGQLAELTGDSSWQPTFMFRMGYPIRPALASPRRGVQEVLL